MTTKHLLGGDLIVAPPTMQDLRFRQTSLLVTYHDLDGTLALCLNKSTYHTLEKITTEVGLPSPLKFPLYWGGPVSQGTIWMLHSPEWGIENTLTISDQLALTSNEEMFWCAQQGDLPRYFRFFHGFCSWQPEQLERELQGVPPWSHKSSWLTLDQPDIEMLLEIPVNELWQHCIELSGQQAVSSWL